MVLATVLLFKRLPQSKFHRGLTIVFLILFAAGAGICGFNTYSFLQEQVNDKNLVIETNKQFENKNFASLTDASISFIHKGESFEAISRSKFINDNNDPLDHYLFSLNPSLNVTEG